MTTAPAFTDWLADRLGTRQWVVAHRLTPYLCSKGYELAVTQKRYTALQAEYDAERRAERIERVTITLFPTAADHMASDPDTWRDRLHAVRTALTAEGF